MTEEEIFGKIAKIIEEHFDLPVEKITTSLDFKKDLDADSIDVVEFVLELEDTFGAEISDEDAESLTTVGDVVTYIKTNTK
ncbi:acyl carrier protein [Dellaglioa sp. BT-FLS60]